MSKPGTERGHLDPGGNWVVDGHVGSDGVSLVPTDSTMLDDYIDYDPDNAVLVGVDDYRPYAVHVGTAEGIRTYRFPDLDSARDFVRQGIIAAYESAE